MNNAVGALRKDNSQMSLDIAASGRWAKRERAWSDRPCQVLGCDYPRPPRAYCRSERKSPTGPDPSFCKPTSASSHPSTMNRLIMPATARLVASRYPQSSRIKSASILLTSTTQPMYEAARLANSPENPASAEEVGQMTRRIGKSLVHDETSRAVDMALGVAKPGRGVA